MSVAIFYSVPQKAVLQLHVPRNHYGAARIAATKRLGAGAHLDITALALCTVEQTKTTGTEAEGQQRSSKYTSQRINQGQVIVRE
jgi:hypothetical protein